MEGLTLLERRAIYADFHRAAMLASYEARHRVPIETADPGIKKLYDQLENNARASVSKKHQIDIAHLDRIEHEGDIQAVLAVAGR